MRYTEERYEDSLKAFRDMKNRLDNAKKEHRVSDWHGTPVGKHGCHYTTLCISYAECAFGRGGESDERVIIMLNECPNDKQEKNFYFIINQLI